MSFTERNVEEINRWRIEHGRPLVTDEEQQEWREQERFVAEHKHEIQAADKKLMEALTELTRLQQLQWVQDKRGWLNWKKAARLYIHCSWSACAVRVRPPASRFSCRLLMPIPLWT